MSKWLAVTLGAVIGLGVGISPIGKAEAQEAPGYAGPCYLHLICDNGMSLECSGAWECDYRTDAPGSPGWIKCDGAGWACNGDIW
ncbi:hypothetical protein JY651_23475 [Pyxidicoccus parkwayensis]|uniref:Uncharacterized protein n=1 Tax=Pyxidicoccus parkwayensis TaxID=2813578 RepID=A0ABX7PB33_9BACT|nr:hypothetical protein [Pyxidicoccus parkwaysis]QSQ27686.1 hypothetical protein JY651_23475 [Pyxidicoccus parkwaysis]